MQISKLPPLGHIGFVVKDIEKYIEEFKRTYSLAGDYVPYDFKPMRVWDWNKEIDGCYLRICKLPLHDGLFAEVIQHISGEVEHKRFVEATGGGMHHIAYHVDDFDAYREYMLSLGGKSIVEMEAEDDIRGYRRDCYFKFEDMDTVIEILENLYFRNK